MMAGGCRIGCGRGLSRCCRSRRRIRLAVIGRGCPTGTRWTRSCWCCGRGCSGTRCTRLGSVPRRRRTAASRSGSRPASSTRSGGRALLSTTPWSGSTGPGWPPTGRWGRHRWVARRRGRTRQTGQKGGETFASVRGAGVPIGLAHDGANRHDSKLLGVTFDSIPVQRPKPTKRRPQGLCLDRGYDYPGCTSGSPSKDWRRTSGGAATRSARSSQPRLESAPLGRRSLPLLAQPQPRPADPLVEEGRQPPRPAPARQRTDRLQESPRRPTRRRPTGIGP